MAFPSFEKSGGVTEYGGATFEDHRDINATINSVSQRSRLSKDIVSE